MSAPTLPCLPRLIHPNPNSRSCPNPNLIRIHHFHYPLKGISLKISNDHRIANPSSPAKDFLRQLSVSSVLILGLGMSSLWAFSSPASARIPPASVAQQLETPDTDNMKKFGKGENIEDEEMKAAFDLWKLKSYALTVPLKIVALEGSLPPIWIREFLRSQGKRVRFRPVFRRSLKDIFRELTDPLNKGKINPKSAVAADLVTLGDSWLNFAIEKGLIEPMIGAEDQDWFKDLSDKWKEQ